ncbi:hypothetical protein [Marinicella litoralis]|uniref:Uncharacterized protein n=1 Tax=Marinicella litoralis TaxID=644220 RepID=A0A4R6XZG7_9GAMM|nr:hypothetical protein [Marinicella litoralis]TDR23697.1 hypothetical protein C8D91_0561 [Marinicella litoralis]
MKKTLLITLLLIQTTVFAQVLAPVKDYAKEVNKLTDISTLLQMSDDTLNRKSYANHEVVAKRLVELRPFNPEFRFILVKAYALQDKKSEAYNELIGLQKAGLSYPVGDQEGFDLIKDTGAFKYIEENMVKNANPYGNGEAVFSVSKNYSGMLFENLAFDKQENRFLLSSIRSGAIYQYTDAGGFEEFIKPGDPATGPWGAIDLVVDNDSDTLWVASAALPHYIGATQANFGQAMISKYKLSTGELVNSFAMQNANQPMLFSALHLTEGKNLYFINAFTSDLFKITKDGDQVEAVVSIPSLSSIKALTSNKDETLLYISDYDLGLFVVNFETNQVVPLIRSKDGFFAGINDLFYDQGDLIVIQGGVYPARLMRYVMKDDVFFQTMFPLEASHENFKALGSGVVVDGHVYYAANSQWEKTGPLGRLADNEAWEDLVIIKTDSKYKMEAFMQQQREIEETKRKRGIK